jgi:hypothetical protein
MAILSTCPYCGVNLSSTEVVVKCTGLCRTGGQQQFTEIESQATKQQQNGNNANSQQENYNNNEIKTF